MKITDVRIWIIRIPWPEMTEGGQSTTNPPSFLPKSRYFVRPENGCLYAGDLESVVVEVVTDQGISGWGEAQSPVGAIATASLLQEVVIPQIVGQDPLDREVIWDNLGRSMATRGHFTGVFRDAVAAVDIALWDIVGHALNVPIATLLGGIRRTRLEAYVSGVPGSTASRRTERACALMETQGFRHFKLALGYGVSEDVNEVQTMRKAVGTGIGIYVDAHWRYTAAEAIRLGHALEELQVGFLEAPVPTENEEALMKVGKNVAIPLAVGEEFRSVHQHYRLLATGMVGVLQPDIGRCGLTGSKDIVQMAKLFGIPVAPHVGVGLGIYVAAALQLAAALPQFYLMECDPDPGLLLANQLLETPLKIDQGAYLVPNGPGLGITINRERL
ncbi:MAG: mandelate racemase/muconate lactonizing enzyme family protein, partial [Firmicutes bacterium]|nr:mandelate racemase/muconate lactonizing enzyme family protein [Bacillota bacterium]